MEPAPASALLPTQAQILLPLLEALDERGPLTPKAAADAVAEKLGVAPGVRQSTTRYRHGDGLIRETNVFERRVRWTRQNAVLAGLIGKDQVGVWELAEAGRKTLTQAKPGIVYAVVTTDLGTVLWAEALSALGYIEDGSLRLILTSPPYPLNRQRAYGGWAQDGYIETMLRHMDGFRRKLMDRGSLVVNLADVYEPGSPTLFTYQEQIILAMQQRGWHLCGRQMWASPAKPKTTPYVTKDRQRLAAGFESFYWWSPTARPYADNRQILEPYSESFRKRYLMNGGQVSLSRSGSRQTWPGRRFCRDNGGKIPYNVVNLPDESSRGPYVKFCRQAGLPIHPARMPIEIARTWIRFVTQPKEMVWDPFGGSLTTAAACQELGRHYIASEKVLEYIQGGVERLRLAGASPETHCSFIEGLRLPMAPARA
ncbi:MAG: site-specific DNA-methyltransferase [Opitutaceae bacterium]|nr:site-specific DNA-methyltransferase [Opitutaceae bacterium]